MLMIRQTLIVGRVERAILTPTILGMDLAMRGMKRENERAWGCSIFPSSLFPSVGCSKRRQSKLDLLYMPAMIFRRGKRYLNCIYQYHTS